MTIENEEQAKEAIAAVGAWLRAGKDAGTFGSERAQSFALDLLERADVNVGMFGCPLCES